MNAELIKYLWLQFSKVRLAVMPCAITMATYIAYLLGGFVYMAKMSQFLVILLVFIWGSRRAADSICSEVEESTWDNVRLACHSPWGLAWGKLVGSTSYVWYGCLWCMPLGIITAHHWGPDYLNENKYFNLTYLILLGVFCQTLAYFAAVLMHHQNPLKGRFRVSLAQLISFAITFVLYINFNSLFDIKRVTWYGYEVATTKIIIFTLSFCIIWLLIGVYRIYCKELGFPSYPIYGILFLASSVAYSYGFYGTVFHPTYIHSFVKATHFFSLIFFAAVTYTYFAAFFENKNFTFQRLLVKGLASGKMAKSFHIMPSWLVTYIIAEICIIFICLFSFYATPMDFGEYQIFSRMNYIVPTVFAIMFFLTRDLAILYFLTLRTKSERGHLAALVWLSFLYSFVPILLSFERYSYLMVSPWAWLTTELRPFEGFICVLLVMSQAIFLLHSLSKRWKMASPIHVMPAEDSD